MTTKLANQLIPRLEEFAKRLQGSLEQAHMVPEAVADAKHQLSLVTSSIKATRALKSALEKNRGLKQELSHLNSRFTDSET